MTLILPPPTARLKAPSHDGMDETWYGLIRNAFRQLNGLTAAFKDLEGDVGQIVLGTAASKNVGTDPGNVVQLDEDGKLPAIDGSQLTGIVVGAWSRIAYVRTNGTGTTSAPSGTSLWTPAATPTTSHRRRVDGVTIDFQASQGGVLLRVRYLADVVVSQPAAQGRGIMGVALYRDSETDAIDWHNVNPSATQPVISGVGVPTLPTHVVGEFHITADDALPHTYRVAILSSNAAGIAYFDVTALSRRVFSIEEVS